jgi:hypothetical protein
MLGLLSAAMSGFSQDARFAVVVNAQNGATNVPLNELRRIFLGERRFWPGSLPVKLIVRAPGTPEHKVVLKLLGMTESEYKQYWTQQVFRGEAQAEPVIVATNERQLEAISRSVGAIAVVDIRDLRPGSKAVRVNQLMPLEKDYPLHE